MNRAAVVCGVGVASDANLNGQKANRLYSCRSPGRGQRRCGKLTPIIPHCAPARAPLPAPSGVTPARAPALSSSFVTIAEAADNCSSGESEAARPPEGGGVRSAKRGKGRSGAEARTSPTSPIRVRFGARAHWGAGSRPKEPPAVPPIGYFRQVSSPVTSAHSPVTSAHSPVTSAHSPVTSAHSPVTSAHSPVTSAHSPVTSAHSPVTSAPDLRHVRQ